MFSDGLGGGGDVQYMVHVWLLAQMRTYIPGGD